MDDFFELMDEDAMNLLYFHNNWSDSCKEMRSVVDEVLKRLDYKIGIRYLDVETWACRKPLHVFQVKTVPTIVLMKQGYVYWRHSGTIDAEKMYLELKRCIWSY